jgi:glycosyltransferase involved in cell wall biosynthesis
VPRPDPAGGPGGRGASGEPALDAAGGGPPILTLVGGPDVRGRIAGRGPAVGARRRGGVRFVAWGAVAGRSQEIAAALGGDARCFFAPGRRRPPVLLRWALSALGTTVDVLVRRPDVLIVTNPPGPAALVGWAAGRAVGARVVLDGHPGAFGAQGDRVAARLQPLHRWVTRRADLSIVASDPWREIVESWGARAVVVHEAPGEWVLRPPVRHRRLRVLCVGRFAADEPWPAVLEAAARCPELDVHMTGDPRRAGVDRSVLPPNVTLVGFLDPARYREAVYGADVVVTLTTEPASVMRAGCEAVWAGRPLVVSDWPVARAAFPYALHVPNDGGSLAAALRRLDRSYDGWAAGAGDARQVQVRRWERQRRALLESCGGRTRGPRSTEEPVTPG